MALVCQFCQMVAAQYGGITGNANICTDSSAFSGPDQPSGFAP